VGGETSGDVVPSPDSELPSPTSLLRDLLDAGLTLDELGAVAQVGDDPNTPDMIKSWLESKREVALALAGAGLAGIVAGFVGDATVIAGSHGVLVGGTETGAVLGMTAFMGACGVSAAYYLRKVRALADKSLRVQHMLNRRRRLP